MQPGPPLELTHDGFIARFGVAGAGLPVLLIAIPVLVLLFALLWFVQAGWMWILLVLWMGATSLAVAALQFVRWELVGSAGQLRIRRWGFGFVRIDPRALIVRTAIEKTRAAGDDGELRKLILETPTQTWTLPAPLWRSEDLLDFAELLRGIRPDAPMPKVPAALRRLQGERSRSGRS